MGLHQTTILLITFGTIILIAIGITLFIVFKPKKVHHGKVPPSPPGGKPKPTPSKPTPSPPPSPPSYTISNCTPEDLKKNNKIGSYGSNCKSDDDCCCMMEKCQKNDTYSQCAPDKGSQWPGTNPPFMTHYWDCCKPTCARAKGITGKQCTSCTPESNYNNPSLDPSQDNPDTNICAKQGENRSMCKAQIPWIEDRILYGYGAVSGVTPNCGDCYEIEFNEARNIDKAIIMITNGGDSGTENVDLAVPGGGFGQFNGCLKDGNGEDLNSEWNVNEACKSYNCIEYGGFTNQKQCDIAFKNDTIAKKACNDVLFGVFGQMGCNIGTFPANVSIKKKTKIQCPKQLEKGNPDANGPVIMN
jgi:hypothetical protein